MSKIEIIFHLNFFLFLIFNILSTQKYNINTLFKCSDISAGKIFHISKLSKINYCSFKTFKSPFN